MNSLSILIYLVGMAEPLGNFALWLCVPGTIGCGIVIIGWFILSACFMDTIPGDNASQYKKDEYDRSKAQFVYAWQWWAKGRNLAITVAVIGWLLYVLTPTKQTLILIAGSELGGRVVQSQAVQSVVDPGLDLVKTWIASETSKLKGELQKQAEKNVPKSQQEKM